jgi:hypothetical protein
LVEFLVRHAPERKSKKETEKGEDREEEKENEEREEGKGNEEEKEKTRIYLLYKLIEHFPSSLASIA